MEYETSQVAVEFSHLLSMEKPNFKRILPIYIALSKKKEPMVFHQYVRELKDISLKFMIEEVSNKHPEFNMKLIHPGELFDETYSFSYDNIGRIIMKKMRNNKEKAIFDNIIKINNFPVVIESSLRERKTNDYKMEVLESTLILKIGYIRVIAEECMHGLNIARFKENGGLVSRFYTSAEKFKQEIGSLIKNSSLRQLQTQ